MNCVCMLVCVCTLAVRTGSDVRCKKATFSDAFWRFHSARALTWCKFSAIGLISHLVQAIRSGIASYDIILTSLNWKSTCTFKNCGVFFLFVKRVVALKKGLNSSRHANFKIHGNAVIFIVNKRRLVKCHNWKLKQIMIKQSRIKDKSTRY